MKREKKCGNIDEIFKCIKMQIDYIQEGWREMSLKIGVIKGDGIGPEIVTEAMKVLDKTGEVYGHISCDYEQLLLGGASIDVHGVPLTDETIATAKAV